MSIIIYHYLHALAGLISQKGETPEEILHIRSLIRKAVAFNLLIFGSGKDRVNSLKLKIF